MAATRCFASIIERRRHSKEKMFFSTHSKPSLPAASRDSVREGDGGVRPSPDTGKNTRVASTLYPPSAGGSQAPDATPALLAALPVASTSGPGHSRKAVKSSLFGPERSSHAATIDADRSSRARSMPPPPDEGRSDRSAAGSRSAVQSTQASAASGTSRVTGVADSRGATSHRTSHLPAVGRSIHRLLDSLLPGRSANRSTGRTLAADVALVRHHPATGTVIPTRAPSRSVPEPLRPSARPPLSEQDLTDKEIAIEMMGIEKVEDSIRKGLEWGTSEHDTIQEFVDRRTRFIRCQPGTPAPVPLSVALAIERIANRSAGGEPKENQTAKIQSSFRHP